MITEIANYIQAFALNPMLAWLWPIVVFASGAWFKAWLDGRNNKSVEKLRSELRKREVEAIEFRKRSEDRISTLAKQVLQMRSNRANTLGEKRIEALLSIWEYVVTAGPLHAAAKFAQSINFKNAIAAAAKRDMEADKIKQFADGVWKMSGLDALKLDTKADKLQPLVTPIVWATFSAYRSIAHYPMAQLAAVRTGVGERILADPREIVELGKATLPHYAKLFEERGEAFLPFVLDDLRDKLLGEITISLDDDTHENRELDRAKAIMDSISKIELPAQEDGKFELREIPDAIRRAP